MYKSSKIESNMSRGQTKSNHQFQELNESILNHLFLPIHLPFSSENDFCLRSNHRNEYLILECLNEYFHSYDSIDSFIQLLIDCTQRWLTVQKLSHLSIASLKSTIEQLLPGAFLPLYFHSQNAAIFIEIDEQNSNQAFISSWQVLLPIETITSSIQPQLSCFPVNSYRLSNRSQLSSTVHCELLIEFMKNPIEYSKICKGSREVMDTKDVPLSNYVCQWWIQQFSEIQMETSSKTSIPFTKKHRDQIRWNTGGLPFRRSGLWMTIKIIFQTILTKHLGNLGIIVYKLLITHFLTYFIYTRQTSINSVELLIHCLRKILRRLNKIDNLILKIDTTDLNKWIQWTKDDIKKKIDEIFPKMDWQRSIQIDDKQLHINVNLNDPEHYRHSCQSLKNYFNTFTTKISNHFHNSDRSINIEQDFFIPSIHILTNQMKYSIGSSLTQMELWIHLWLEQWINQPLSSRRESDHFVMLARFFDDYYNAALNYYRSKDSIGYSRFLLTSLSIIRVMHQKLSQDKRFERLQLHRIDIPNLLNLFEYLILPSRKEMINARDLYDYFSKFSDQSYPDILTDITSEDSFGVYFATHSTKMINCLKKIQIQIEQEKIMKMEEVRRGKDRYTRLMSSITGHSCMCYAQTDDRLCHRCRVEEQANNITVSIYENPIPSQQANALAVIFELRMPIEIRCYRDILWQFINRSQNSTNERMYEWLRTSPHSCKLTPLYTGPNNCKVKLVSRTTSITQSHENSPHIGWTQVDDFLYENSLDVRISPTRELLFETECRMLTPQLDHPDYKHLQYSLQSTEFIQNRVIADLSQISSKLKPKQFIEFGSFRSGHRLQWWNLLSILEIDSLSLNEESIALLIVHSILQYGPVMENPDGLVSSWCPESHRKLLDDHFVDELIVRLDRHLDDCASNWQNEFILVVITMITMRILTLCNSTREEKVKNLALKCRRIAEKWIDQISSTGTDELKRSIVTIGVACLLTFSTDLNRIHHLLSSNEHIISLLKTTTTIHDNTIWNNKQTSMSNFRNDLIRLTERLLVQMQPTIDELLQKLSYRSLDDFAVIYWVAIRNEETFDGKWQKRNKYIYDSWYDGQYQSTSLSINSLQGIFLINGLSVGYLPEKILFHQLYLRVFEHQIFQVQITDSPNTYITDYDNGRVQYLFHFDDRLVIYERYVKTNELFQLIPPECLENELPITFISEYSHWKNIKTQRIEFRPIHFKDPNFFHSKPYTLDIETGHIITTSSPKTQILVNQSSSLFHNFYTRYFSRLDDKQYVYMLREEDTIIHVHLSRLAIAFQYNANSRCFYSREYPDMCIDENQWLGTLTGLQSGLILSPRKLIDYHYENLQFRKLIIPFGHVHARRIASIEHQSVTIQRKSSMSYSHHYFVFVMNDRLRIIQSMDSPTGWLYLALIHALTSHSLPDQYTGMTGMERAFQLLNSAGSWTDQPFDPLSLNILQQIALISPKVNYNQHFHSRAFKIDWNDSSISYSLQHFGYYLIVKQLIKNSERLNFMHPSSSSRIEENEYDERLLTKLYWDYRHSYNPIARLSEEIIDTKIEVPYRPTIGQHSSVIKQKQVHLVNDLYHTGDVQLKNINELSCFPLNRWLTDEYQLNIVWIGLFKLADSIKTTTPTEDDLERFELLLNFLHYISNRPFYIQILNTVLRSSNLSLTFPPFTQYHNIQQISVVMNAINFNSHHSASERRTIIEEVKDCLETGSTYKNQCRLVTSEEKNQIKWLLKSWSLNRKLHSFLMAIENVICSFDLIPFPTPVSVHSQQFLQKSIENHYQMEMKSSKKPIDPQLLFNARQKYLSFNSNPWIKSTQTIKTVNHYQQFPGDIFDDQTNHLNEIGDFFKKQLAESWKQLQSTEIHQNEYPSKEELIQLLQSSQQESDQLWNELTHSITDTHEQVFQIGLLPRPIPTILISLFHQLTEEQCILLGGLIVNWVIEQQIERALHLVYQNRREEFEKELSNIPHRNWIPSEHLPWLIFELEMNITIREIQVEVTRHMMQSSSIEMKNLVMQMNMGEGKTSVILPMLALCLSSSKSCLVRIVVLKSLFRMNYQLLRFQLGGLLNRRIFPFTCRRDMNFTNVQVNEIFDRFQQGLRRCDIVQLSPEDILSFDLLTIDKCRRQEFETARSMLIIQRWLKTFSRDVLDESDEILHWKYQLIYTVGAQQPVDGGEERWKLIQSILNSVKKFALEIFQSDRDDIYYKSPKGSNGFPEFRLLSHRPFPKLCTKIVHDWFNQKSYRKTEKQSILSFILDPNTSVDGLIDRFSLDDIQLFLILRGLLSAEVLYIALKKRYRVHYGVDHHSDLNRLMSVPFRAKDVPADRTEFGHPDIALVLTQLSYYYSGLDDCQLIQCFDRLSEEERDPESIYAEWICQEEENDLPQHFKQWKGVNRIDYQEETRQIFDLLRYNILVINYFLNSFVFPREAKQFPYKLVSSAWDLSSPIRSHRMTGFSGTNDTQLLLPVHIQQCDLPQLQKTDAIVINNLLQPENEHYRNVSANTTSEMILSEIAHHQPTINVILDVGAMFVDGTNREIAMNWLKLSDKDKVDYAIYFQFDLIVVCDRQFQHNSFFTSPASERLDRCVIYFDEVHTRGTDFKFPRGFLAAVTLGNGLTKDRFVQACMRMRMLGQGHSLIFWSPDEVHRQIINSYDSHQVKDILHWVYENSKQAVWDGLHHWAVQSLNFQRKLNAFQNIDWTNEQQIFSDQMLEELAEKCLESEIIELKSMYGVPRVLQTISEIYTIRYEHSDILASEEVHNAVRKRLYAYGGSKQRLSQFLDEEQQRELEQELVEEQEREQEHEQKCVRPMCPCKPTLHAEVKRLSDQEDLPLVLADLPSVFRHLPYAFIDSTFSELCQPNSWQTNLWITTEFQRVIETKGELLDPFLRPPRWIVIYRNEHIIFVNALEANWLMGQLQHLDQSSTTTLRLLLPRLKRNQSIFVNTSTLTIPPSIPFILPVDWLVQLFIFNGTLYFETVEEQSAYCNCLALCPRLRTMDEENAFENGWIATDGFVQELKYRIHLTIDPARFSVNPLPFIKQLLRNRNNTNAFSTSHVGSIIFNCLKSFSPSPDPL